MYGCFHCLNAVQDCLAANWFHMMPERALAIIRNQKLAPGGDLVKLDCEYGRPSAKEHAYVQPLLFKCFIVRIDQKKHGLWDTKTKMINQYMSHQISYPGDFQQFYLDAANCQVVSGEGTLYIYVCVFVFIYDYVCAFSLRPKILQDNVILQVPSGFYLTDALLVLDQRFEGHLLIPDGTRTKVDIAARESRRLKKLLGALRHLWRNSAFSQVCH